MRPTGFSATLFLANETETSRLGAAVAGLLKPADVLLLDGPIGAGKTHLARSIIQTRMSVPEDVPSPTYTIVQTYDVDGIEIWHADLYRLTNSAEIAELGLEEAFETSIVLVEWPDQLGDLAPSDALHVRLAPEGDGRRVKLASVSDRWSKLDAVLADV